MKNPFSFLRRSQEKPEINNTIIDKPEPEKQDEKPEESAQKPGNAPEKPKDGFVEWGRSRIRGGIEKRGRNIFFEQYSVYGLDGQEQLSCRLYHRYPEDERDFGLSYTRALSFGEFNSRLLYELDRGDMSLCDYSACMSRAEKLREEEADTKAELAPDLSEDEQTAIQAFFDSLDNLKDKSCRCAGGVFRCDAESAAMGESLTLMLRKPLRYDAYFKDDPSVKREPVAYYDIEDIWIMGVCNRLIESGAKIDILTLRSAWSLDSAAVYLMTADGLPGINGRLLLAIAESTAISRFGFYSLDPLGMK